MKNIYFIILSFMFFSCSQDAFIYYEYDGVTITRVDDGNQIYFYYGKYDNSSLTASESYVKAEYSGFNSGMNAYLNFQENDIVEVIRVEALFETNGLSDSLILVDMDNIRFITWRDSIRGNYGKIVEVSDIVKLEKKRNKQNNSRVNAIYPN